MQAGLIFSNIRNNQTAKHIWLSASADLADDARRDFDDIGGGNVSKNLLLEAG